MRPHNALNAVRLTLAPAAARLLGGLTLVGVSLLVANCGQDQMMGPAGPTRLVFSVEPGAAIAGAAIAPAVRVEARDAENNLSSNYTGAVTVAIATNPGSGTLSGTLTVSAVGGVANFDDLSINKSGDGYTLTVSSGRLTAATSAPFDINPGPASKLVYVVEPTAVTAGAAMAPAVEIEARDDFDNVDVNFTGAVTLAITSGTGHAGAILSGTQSVTAVAGVAAFDDLSIDKSGTGYTFDAASGALRVTSAAFDVEAGAASQLVFGVEPSDASAGVMIAPAVEVIAQDALGNIATGYAGNVTVAIATNPGSGTLSGTATVAAVAGVATFSDLSIDKVGSGYTLSASGSGLGAVASAAFAISTAQVSQLVFTVPPSSATAGQPITPAIEVTAQDAYGNTVTSFVDNVTVAIVSGGGSASASPPGAPAATLSGTATVAAVAGVATFGDLTIDEAGNGYTLGATSGALSSAPTQQFAIDPDVASQLDFTVQPSDAISGAPITVEVAARDPHGNIATSFTGAVTVAIDNNAGSPPGTLSGTLTQSAVDGVATFPDLSIDIVGTGYTLAASASGLSSGTSSAFDIAAAGATQLVFTQGPTTTMAGQPFAPVIEVTAQDDNGNPVTSFTGNVTMTIGTNPGSGVLSGQTVVAAVNGVAAFSDLSIGQAATGYRLQAASATLTSPLSSPFDITPAPATAVTFTVQPSDAQAGVPIAPAVQVTAFDAFGNTATGFTGDVTVAIDNNAGSPPGTLSGTLTQSAVAGVATFSDLSIDMVGTGYTLSAAASGLAGATSGTFEILVGTATQLVFTQDPTTTTAGQSIAPAVQVTAWDAMNNIATDFNGPVTVGITAGTGAAGAVLSGSATVTAVQGVATFDDLSIDKAGIDYSFTATSGTLTEATSAAFDINAGQAAELVFTQQPTDQTAGQQIAPAVAVTARDAVGNLVPGFAGDITLSITAGTGSAGATLFGTLTQTAVDGVATFNDLRIDQSGTGFTLDATSTGVPVATSAAFAIDHDVPSELVFTTQPSDATAAAAIDPAVQVTARDQFGNVATGFTDQVSMAITAGTGAAGAVLSGTGTVDAIAGVATFSDLSIDKPATDYSLTATSGTIPEATSAAFAINAGQAAELVFTQQPTDQIAGQSIAPAIVVTAQDAVGNTATGFSGNVTMTIGANPGGGILAGTRVVAAENGVATFNDLSIGQAATGYQLQAASATLTTPLSNPFDITPAPATAVTFTVQPSDAQSGVPIAPPVEVTALDAFGNTATDFTGEMTVAIASNPGGGTLSGTATVAANAGVAMFDNLSIDKAGAGYTLSAASSGLAGATSGTFEILVGTSTQLVFTQDPTATTAGQPIAPAVQVTAQDAMGNLASDFNGPVTVAITAGTGAAGAVLSGSATVTAVQGVATFDDLSIDKAGADYSFTATSGTLTEATSAAFAINAGQATELVFTQQPTDQTAGQSIAPAVALTARDALGNTATGFTADVTLAITAGTGSAGATLGGTPTQAAVAGVVTYNDLRIDQSGTGFTLDATSTGVPVATSAAFAINHDVASELFFSTEPSDATAATTISPAVQVTARDQFGNVATSFTDQVSMAITAGTGTAGAVLSGAGTVGAIAGVATFGDLSIDKSGTGYTFDASAAGLPTGTSAAFNINAAAFSQLAFSVQPPASAEAGAPFTVEVTAQDAQGNTVPSYTGDVDINLGANPVGGTLNGTLTIAAVAGVATFDDLNIDKSGDGYQLQASSGGFASPLSTAFNITPGAASQLAFTQQPTSQAAGATITPPVEATALDQFGNVVTAFTDDVTLAIGSNPAGGTLSGALVKPAAAGVVAFDDLSIDRSGTGYTLTVSSGALTQGTSAAFDITAAAASKLVFTVDPVTTIAGETITPAVEVTALDDFDNVATGFSGDIDLAIDNNPGTATLSGTVTVTATAGTASFGDLSLDKSGTAYTLSATSGALTLATSAEFDINPAAPSKLAFTVQPTDTEAGNGSMGGVIAPAVELTALDAFDNVVTDFVWDVTLGITGGSGSAGATMFGTLTQTASGGVATFGDLSIDVASPTPAGTNPYTLTATAGTLTPGISAGFEITGGAATQLVLTVQPTNATAGNGTVGGTISPAVTVAAQDALGNADPNYANDVTLSFVNDASLGLATLFNGTETATGGVATFTNLAIDKAATGYTLQATSGGMTSPTSDSFDITPGPATQLGYVVQPSGTTPGAAITPAVQVSGQDAVGNTDPTYSGTITLSKASGPGILSGTLSQATVNGVATFSDLTLDQAGTYRLRARANGFTRVTSDPFNIISNPPVELVFVTQPNNATAGDGITVLNYIAPAVRVEARDALGQTITDFGDQITLTISSGPIGATLRLDGATPVTVVPGGGGVATFSNLSIDKSRTDYRLRAEVTSGSFMGVSGTSQKFDIGAGPADHLGFTGQPSTTNASAVITPQVEVTVQDALDNRVAGFAGDVSMSIGNDPSGGAATLSGTTIRPVTEGVATFTDLSIDAAAVGYTLSASGLGLATSAAFDILPGTASGLFFTQQPSDAVAGATITPPIQVEARDASGNLLSGYTGDVTIMITAGTGPAEGSLYGTTTVAAVGGVATFSDLFIDLKGSYRLSVTAAGLSGATSGSFSITPGAAARLDFKSHPATTPAGQTIPTFEVRGRDAYGNIATSFVGDVTLSIGVNPSGGTLSGTTTVAAVNGSAFFTDISIDKAGSPYRLEASSPGVASDLSVVFEITPGTVDHLLFTVQPTDAVAGVNISPVSVAAVDAFDNVVPSFIGDVTLALTPGTGSAGATLDGTTTAGTVNGVATFGNLNVKTVGNGYTMDASAVGVPSGGTSAAFNITPAGAGQLAFATQPSNTTAGVTMAPVQVRAVDQFGNTDTNFTGNVTIQIGTNPGSGTLNGTLVKAAVAGVATFDDLSIESAGSGYTLDASGGGFPGATSAAFDITPAAASQLVFTVQPSNAASGASITPAVEVTALDPFGNIDTNYVSDVSIAIGTNPGLPPGTLSGTSPKAAVAGVATFSDLSIDSVGNGYTLVTTSGTLPSAESTPFDITL